MYVFFQGSLVAILYCFTNKDVKEELQNLNPQDYCCCCLYSNGQRREGRLSSLMSTTTKASRLVEYTFGIHER